MRHSCRIAALGIVLLAATTPAFAHAHLVSSVPPANASVPGPQTLVLHFSEPVEPRFTGITLEDSKGRPISTAATLPASSDPATIIVSIPEKLATGRYEVAWHALAVDGHKTNGSYAFTVTP